MATPNWSSAQLAQIKAFQSKLSESDQAYLKANPDVALSADYWDKPSRHYRLHGEAEGRGFGAPAPKPQESGGGGGWEMPSMEGMFGDFDFAGQMAQQQASYEQQMAEQRRIMQEQEQARLQAEGLAARDSAYSAYLDTAGAATDFVTGEITREKANADLLGIDYNIDDEVKTSRINDYFATMWGEGDQRQLDQLISQWGKPSGFGGFTVVRGAGGSYQGGAPAKEETVAVSEGSRQTLLTGEEDDEDRLGGGTSVLGV